MKKCRMCEKDKAENNFHKTCNGNLSTVCKECHRIRTDKWKSENKEKCRFWSKRYRKNNPEKAKKANLASYKKRMELRGDELRAAKKIYDRNFCLLNKEKKKKQAAEYYKTHKQSYNALVKKKSRVKLMELPGNKIHALLSTGVYRNLQRHKISKNGESVFKILGYSLEDLMCHLEKQFTSGMSWENYGKKGWEIDHKVPRAYFEFSSINDLGFIMLWSLENLQPLWAGENIEKRDKVNPLFLEELQDNTIARIVATL